MSEFQITPDTRIRFAHLHVADLNRSLTFYVDRLGFQVLSRDGSTVFLSADGKTPQMMLTELPGAQPKPRQSTGLYHVAILLPSRQDLARLFHRLAESRVRFQGASDHGVSEALYLADPDGNGLELYADRPRSGWYEDNGELKMYTIPLDIESLLSESTLETVPWTGIAPGTTVGHVHLHVPEIEPAVAFYRDVLGLDLLIRSDEYGMAFLSAGGYHHHIGLNTWAGRGAPRPPEDAVGLRSFAFDIPDAASWQTVLARAEAAGMIDEAPHADNDLTRAVLHDSDGNQVILTIESRLLQAQPATAESSKS